MLVTVLCCKLLCCNLASALCCNKLPLLQITRASLGLFRAPATGKDCGQYCGRTVQSSSKVSSSQVSSEVSCVLGGAILAS